MFHYKHESVEYGIQHAEGHLFLKAGENPLIKEFGFYVISRLHTFQNMHESFQVDDKTDIDAFICHATLLHEGTRVYSFSKELLASLQTGQTLAFLQTLVAFSPYYVANDPNAAGPMDSCYAEALRDYAAVTYEALHRYLIEGLRCWYEKFLPSEEGGLGRC
jgi:hypothetical protein